MAWRARGTLGDPPDLCRESLRGDRIPGWTCIMSQEEGSQLLGQKVRQPLGPDCRQGLEPGQPHSRALARLPRPGYRTPPDQPLSQDLGAEAGK